MRQIKGFKDGIYFHNWEDQQYSTKFWVIICPEKIEEAKPFLQRITKTELEVSETTRAMCSERIDTDKRHHVFIFLTSNTRLGSIVHECVHAKNYVFGYHGVFLSVDHDEHEAYYVDYLFSNAEAVLKDYHNKTKE